MSTTTEKIATPRHDTRETRIVIKGNDETLRRRNSIIERHGLGWVSRGDEARQVTHGPMVPGPWAYAYGLSTVIDNNGGSGRESQEALEAKTEHWFNYGDFIEINGIIYVIVKAPNQNIRFERVKYGPEFLPPRAQAKIDWVESLEEDRLDAVKRLREAEADLEQNQREREDAKSKRSFDAMLVDILDEDDDQLTEAELEEIREEVLKQIGWN